MAAPAEWAAAVSSSGLVVPPASSAARFGNDTWNVPIPELVISGLPGAFLEFRIQAVLAVRVGIATPFRPVQTIDATPLRDTLPCRGRVRGSGPLVNRSGNIRRAQLLASTPGVAAGLQRPHRRSRTARAMRVRGAVLRRLDGVTRHRFGRGFTDEARAAATVIRTGRGVVRRRGLLSRSLGRRERAIACGHHQRSVIDAFVSPAP